MSNPQQSRSSLAWMRLPAARYLVAIAVAILPAISIQPSASAQTFHRLHSFKGEPHDGRILVADLVRDSAGNLYGTTEFGGAFNQAGTVFKLDAHGKETILHNFCSARNCSDGEFPRTGLIRDTAGNLYGTTEASGGHRCQDLGCGVVFKLDKTGKETVLHRFSGGADGARPDGDLVLDQAGNIYGTTAGGGSATCNAPAGCGVVFELDKTGKETVLHTFTGKNDGASPQAGLLRDDTGNLYGTTSAGGTFRGVCAQTSGCGVVFKVDKHGKFKVLYTFTYGADGGRPQGRLASDAAGNLYGTTVLAGDFTVCADGCGVVFKLDTAGKYSVLYSFKFITDGSNPYAGVVLDPAGNLYGTTNAGGTHNFGTVFRVDTSGIETVLHSFNGFDGMHPQAGLVRDSRGNLYGTTYAGGAHCIADTCGVVFELSPQ